MEAVNVKGRNIAYTIAAYQGVKLILNMILGGGFDLLALLILIATVVFATIGLKFTNYAMAGVLVFIVLLHLSDNISNFSSNWIYLLEGLIDLFAAYLLIFNNDVKEQFSRELSEIKK